MGMITKQSMKQAGMELTHLVGEFVLVNDIYRLVMGEDWLSKEKSNRVEAAGWLGLVLLPYSKLTNIAKEIKAGNKLLKGVGLTADELKILNDAGYFDKAIKVENIGKTSRVKGTDEVNKAASRTVMDFRKVNIQTNKIGETLATRKEIRAYKKEWGEVGIKVNIDKKGAILPENVEPAFDFINGNIFLKKKPSVINMHHEGFHAEQWLNIGKEQYVKLSRLEREEYVFEQVMKNKHLFDIPSIEHSIDYIDRLRLKYK